MSIAINGNCALPLPTFIWRAWVNALPETLFERRDVLNSSVVPDDESARLAFYVAHLGVGVRRNRGWLSTSTLTQFVCRWGSGVASVVTVNESDRLPLNPASFFAGYAGKGCGIATSTFTEFWRGLFSGMLRHVVSPFSTIGHAGGCFQHRSGTSMSLHLHYTTEGNR